MKVTLDPPSLHSAAPPPSTGGPGTVAYSMIGVGVVLVVLALLVVMVLIGKRRRVTAKIWRPTSPSSDATPSGDVGGGSHSAGTVVAAESL